MNLPTFNELYQAGQNEIQARNSLLTDFNAGSVLDAVTGGGAVMADEVIRVLLRLFAAQFVDTATGTDLDALAADRFGLTRKAASASVGALTFSQSSGSTFTVPAGTVCRATVGGRSVTFTTDAAVDVPSGTPADVNATCTVTGPTGNVDSGTVTTVVDALDVTCTVTNDDRFVGGAASEADPAFRDRIRRFYTTQRRATKAALENGALTVPGVYFAAVEERASGGISYVAITVGDPDGRGNSALADAVVLEMENWRAAGVPVQVYAASREEISLTIAVVVRPGSDQDALRTLIRGAIVGYTDQLAPGAMLYISQVIAAVVDASDLVLGANPLSPSTDVAPSAAANAIRVVPADITLAFVEG